MSKRNKYNRKGGGARKKAMLEYRWNNHHLPSGTPKVAKDEEGARIAAREMAERLNLRFTAYRCCMCDAWHVGRDKTRGSVSDLLLRTTFDIGLEVELGSRAMGHLTAESKGPKPRRLAQFERHGRTVERLRKRDYAESVR